MEEHGLNFAMVSSKIFDSACCFFFCVCFLLLTIAGIESENFC